MKYILSEWPESQFFMEYVGLPYNNPNRCIYGADSSDIFVPEELYNKTFPNEALSSN